MPTERLFDTIDEITLKNLSKKYGDQYAVNDLSLTVDGGELLILIGGSGSGKTTTLKMINRLIKPDTGTIKINNTDITTINEVILRRNIGYVIQQIGLFPHMTIHENIGLIPQLENWPKQKINTRITELLRLVDLPPETFQHRYPKELSGGQQQRIGLARALTMDPRLLLMDEPFGALDPILRRQLHEEFLKLKKELHRTIIFVTHDINEAFKLGDRIAVMDQGKLQQIDTPQELLLNPANDVVSTLVDADQKFRHLDTLTAQDIMTKIQPQHIQPHTQTIKQLKNHFTQHNIEHIFITKKSEFIGWITLNDMLQIKSNSETIEKYIKSAMTFSASDSMSAILHEMKQKQQSIAVIIKNNQPIGFLIPDEVLLKLI